MNAAILLMIWSLPLMLAVLAGQRYASWITLVAPLPALIAAVAVPVGTSISLPWLLLGVELGLDATSRVFLLFSALLWLVASLYGIGSATVERNRARYRVFFLLAMAGNLGLIVAQDTVSFYLGFTLMGLAAYGLITHSATRRARQAARRYLVWTIAGELLLFVAIVMLAMQHGGTLAFTALQSSPPAGIVVLLLVIGFGIKLAVPGLHFWLPQAYAVTPAPAVAVLSGAMIKAGLLGWLRFLPPGDASLVDWGQVLIIAGVTGMFYGAVVGLLQHQPRLLLGYSSISKMGVLTIGMGAALAWPAAAPLLTGALVLYAAHHALVKAALFLGLGLVERGGPRPWLLAGLGFLALALAGAPLTSGALAKSALTGSLPAEAHYLVSLLALAAIATTLLMARFLVLIWRQRGSAALPHAIVSTSAWLGLVAVIVVLPFALSDSGRLLTGVVPLSLGALLAALALLAAGRWSGFDRIDRLHRASGQLIACPARAIRHLIRRARRVPGLLQRAWHTPYQSFQQVLRQRLSQLWSSGAGENEWPWAGSLWLAIGGLLLVALMQAD